MRRRTSSRDIFLSTLMKVSPCRNEQVHIVGGPWLGNLWLECLNAEANGFQLVLRHRRQPPLCVGLGKLIDATPQREHQRFDQGRRRERCRGHDCAPSASTRASGLADRGSPSKSLLRLPWTPPFAFKAATSPESFTNRGRPSLVASRTVTAAPSASERTRRQRAAPR